MLQPPTQQQMQRAVTRDSLDAQSMTTAIERARKDMPLGQPAPRARVLIVIAGVFVAAIGTMFLTSRQRS